MLRLIVSELAHRRGRALAMLAGIAVATASFTVLTGASDSSRLEVRGNVTRHFRTAYDVLVRPRGSTQPLERRDGLVQQNFLSGIFGGITMGQYRAVGRTPGVDVAAPLAVFGYVMPTAYVPVRLGDALRSGTRTAFSVRTRWSAAHGTVVVRDPDSYVYVTRRPLAPFPPHDSSQSVKALAFEDLGSGGGVQMCPIASSAASAFSLGARSWLSCWSTRNGRQGLGRYGDPASVVANLGAQVAFPFPLLIAGIDPDAEARLSGADRAVVSGRYLRSDEGVRTVPSSGIASGVVPVLAASSSAVDLTARAEVRRLPARAGAEFVAARVDRGAARRALEDNGPGTPVAARTVRAPDAYAALLDQLRVLPTWIDALWTAGPSRYTVLGPKHLRAQPVASDPFVWGSAYGWTGTGEGFVNAPVTGHDLGFRRIDQHIVGASHMPLLPMMQAVGTFDPSRLAGATNPEAAPLNPFHPATTALADERSARVLGGDTLAPDGNMAGYATPAPALLTTLAARKLLLNPNVFSNAQPQQAAPISVIRVRVRGVTGVDATSRERIRVVAERIAKHTGLQVDVTAGSSTTPVRVELPASRLGRPRVTLGEGWIKKGVATAILTAVDRKSLILFALVLLVCALFCVNATAAAVRTRTTELGVLACVGWPARRLFAYLLTEVGLIGLAAGVIGTLVALPAGWLLGLPVSGARALVAIPAATLLALAAGAVPAARAARSDPLEAVRPAVRPVRSARAVRSVAGLATINLRRVPGRTLLGALSLSVGVFALTLLLAVTFAFRGAVVGTVLGDAVAVQVRTADYVAVAATLVLGGLAVADVLYLNLRDRSAEIATLRATGWREIQLTRLVALEGAGLGAVGGIAGALLGLGAAALFAGQWTTTMGLVAAAGAGVGLLIAILASIAPIVGLRRLPTATLLAEE
ncbi:MAG TPA: ABC transporter permease [Baekduia sp.]|nr:ABC transporter permease [Baekduia sp.]